MPKQPLPVNRNTAKTLIELRESLRQTQFDYEVAQNRIKDLQTQLVEARQSVTVTSTQTEEMQRIRAEHTQLHNQVSKLVLWLRNNRTTELERGDFQGQDIMDVVIGMLAKVPKVN